MRYALIADIHSNIEAFEAVIAHARAHGVSRFMLIGDLVGYGADPEAVLERCMALLEWGYAIQKFFPAEPAGGTAYLSSLASPLPQVRFCPTGGITPEKAPAYLKLSNVITIGGSWMAPKRLIEAKDWAGIEKLAAEAAGLASLGS